VLRSIIDTIAAIDGEEEFWIDDVWYANAPCEGTYGMPLEDAVKPQLFPSRSLAPLFDYAHEHGLGSTIWFMPETAQPAGSQAALPQYPPHYANSSALERLFRAHPDWHYPKPALKDACGESFTYNLASPSAREWMANFVVAAAAEWHFDVFRIERACGGMGSCLGVWEDADVRAPRRPETVGLPRNGSTELQHVAGLYMVLDKLRQAHPNVVVDNCAGGGQSVDLELVSRSVHKWRSDYGCTEDTLVHYSTFNQLATMGLSFFQPLNSGSLWISRKLCEGADMPLSRCHAYAWRSATTTGVAIQWDQRFDDAEIRGLTSQGARETQRLRSLILHGDLYLLTNVTSVPSQWAGWQYHNAVAQSGAALLFRREDCTSSQFQAKLLAIDLASEYDVQLFADSYKMSSSQRLSGASLSAYIATVPVAPGSLLLQYQRLSETEARVIV